jgi:predicted TPR repeat methyltransferase
MAQTSKGQDLLENAYKVRSPSENVEYYKAFAPSYDTEFAEKLGWSTPKAIAAAYHEISRNDLPIADIGCGTGIVAQELRLPPEAIDGMDISPDMLAIASEKKLYRELFEVDLTGPLGKISGNYGAVLSAGTFTIGHLGPEPLHNLLNIVRSGGLFIIGVYEKHFEMQNFSRVLDDLVREHKITAVSLKKESIYSKTDHAHANDLALILQYRKI